MTLEERAIQDKVSSMSKGNPDLCTLYFLGLMYSKCRGPPPQDQPRHHGGVEAQHPAALRQGDGGDQQEQGNLRRSHQGPDSIGSRKSSQKSPHITLQKTRSGPNRPAAANGGADSLGYLAFELVDKRLRNNPETR